MTGILAQTISITSFGNEYLKGWELSNFYPENSTFQFCKSVDFREIKKKNIFTSKKEIIVANTPIEWFIYLKKNGCKRLQLYYQTEKNDDYKSAGFVGGGGNWFIKCVYEKYSDFWISNWNHNNDLKEKPWLVTYEKAAENQVIINQSFDVIETANKLKDILERITEFAYKETTENWGKIFEKSIETLNDKNPETDFYHTDLIVSKNYQLKNRQLLMSASKAFVFGGMGSWNDMWFENEEVEEKYNSLSSELYAAIMKAIGSAINNDNA
jgi:hypothetical protein